MKRLIPMLMFPALLLAHADRPIEPHDLWTAWRFEPGIVIPLVLSAWLYVRGGGARKIWFWSGWGVLALALISPLHPLGEALFSAHMAQHEILMLIAAPLFVYARPLAPMLRALPSAWRRPAGRWSKACSLDPFHAWWVHAVALWAWHAPVLFQLTLRSELAHTAQHLSFFVSALVFWEALFATRGRGVAVVYIFTTAIHTSILGALLTFSQRLWYPAYASTVPAWGLTPLEDQQIGGLLMWVPAGVIYTGLALAVFAAWLRESEARYAS
jgi:cytochrome c oxidase assembly factor CtaG